MTSPREPVAFLTRAGKLIHNNGRQKPEAGDRPLYDADAIHQALETGYARGWRDGEAKALRGVGMDAAERGATEGAAVRDAARVGEARESK